MRRSVSAVALIKNGLWDAAAVGVVPDWPGGNGTRLLSQRVMAGGAVNCQHGGESRWVCKAQTRGIADNQRFRKHGWTHGNKRRARLTLSLEDEDI